MKITDDLKYIYGETLLDKNRQPTRHTLTIADVIDDEFVDATGRKSKGFSLIFRETKRMLGVTGVTVRRQIDMAVGADTEKMIGQKIKFIHLKSFAV